MREDVVLYTEESICYSRDFEKVFKWEIKKTISQPDTIWREIRMEGWIGVSCVQRMSGKRGLDSLLKMWSNQDLLLQSVHGSVNQTEPGHRYPYSIFKNAAEYDLSRESWVVNHDPLDFTLEFIIVMPCGVIKTGVMHGVRSVQLSIVSSTS